MAARKPLVIIDGILQQLPAGDTLDAYTLDVDVVVMENDEATASANVGAPVYISGDGQVKLAQANAASTSSILGLAKETIAAGSTGPIQTDGVITSSDWSAITESGNVTLTPGALYFLSPLNPGKITTTAPTNTGEVVTRIGRAITTVDLEISITQPILL